MPLPLKVFLTPAKGVACGRCRNDGPAVVLSVFTDLHHGRTEPICLACFGKREEIDADLVLSDLGPKRGPAKRLRRQKRVSQKQEIEVAEALGARVQKASGALAGSKGDGRRKGVLRFEAKFTEAGSFNLLLEDLAKIHSECHTKERPVMVIDFLEKGTGLLRGRFAVLHFEDAKEMLNALHD